MSLKFRYSNKALEKERENGNLVLYNRSESDEIFTYEKINALN